MLVCSQDIPIKTIKNIFCGENKGEGHEKVHAYTKTEMTKMTFSYDLKMRTNLS